MRTYSNSDVPMDAIKVGKDIGRVVDGYFASSAWLKDGHANNVSGRSFGWYDLFDTKQTYVEDKSKVRPLSQAEWDTLSDDQKAQFKGGKE